MRNFILTVYVTFALGLASILSAQPVEWSYSGETGPEHWADLSPDYALCGSGKNQSPINIDEETAFAVRERGVKFNYGLITPATIKNTGKLIRVDVDPGTNIKADGVTFELKHLDIHMPSEHTVNKKRFPMEIQFVHQSKDKQLAVVSMLVVPGRPDRTLSKLLEQLPMKAGESRPLASNALRNMEQKKKLAGYYQYSGSMTSPPCSEGVHWFIMKNLMTFSQGQYQQFKAALNQKNSRPVQPLHARIIMQ